MTKKEVFLARVILSIFIASLFLLSQNNALAQDPADQGCPKGKRMVNGECVRTLEVVYPNILGKPAPETVAEGLPSYVTYIFRFSIAIIGFIILYVLLYSGFKYLTSTGNPTALSDAKSRILEGLLGAIILFASYLIFNTINPQLTQIKIEPADPVRPVIKSGIYVCEKSFNNTEKANLADKIESYKNGETINAIVKSAEELGTIMKDKNCQRLSVSGSFPKKISKNNVIFSLPNVKIENNRLVFFEDEGLILHEKDNRLGQCFIFNPYTAINPENAPNFNFSARSFTVYQIPSGEESQYIATLYSCLYYNNDGNCKIGKNIEPKEQSFVLGNQSMQNENLSNNGLKENVRSVKLDPVDNFFVVLKNADSTKCEVIIKNDPNLLDNDIGRCGPSCWFILRETNEKQVVNCTPCATSITLIKGQVR